MAGTARRLRRRREAAVAEPAGVEADHLVPGGDQHRRHDRADVAQMTGDQHSHRRSSSTAAPTSPRSPARREADLLEQCREPWIVAERGERRRGRQIDQARIVDLDRAIEPVERVVESLESGIHGGEVERRHEVALRRRGQPLRDRLRLGAPPRAREPPAEIGVVVLSAGELCRATQRRETFVEAPALDQHVAELAMREPRLRKALDRAVQIALGLGGPSGDREHTRALGLIEARLRLERDGAIEGGDRLVETLGGHQHHAVPVPRRSVAWIEPERLTQRGLGGGEAPSVEILDQPHRRACGRELRLETQRSAGLDAGDGEQRAGRRHRVEREQARGGGGAGVRTGVVRVEARGVEEEREAAFEVGALASGEQLLRLLVDRRAGCAGTSGAERGARTRRSAATATDASATSREPQRRFRAGDGLPADRAPRAPTSSRAA